MAGWDHRACIVELDAHPVAFSYRQRCRPFVPVAMSSAQIAAELRCFGHCADGGRSAVIGKISRLKLPQPADKKAEQVPADHWGYFKVPGNWPRLT